jgi:hypothetical protein
MIIGSELSHTAKGPKSNHAASDTGTILLLWRLRRCHYSMQAMLYLDSGGETFRIQRVQPIQQKSLVKQNL